MKGLQRLRPQRLTGGDDGVAILMALAYIGIFLTLMLAMLAVVIGQVKPTALARRDLGSVNAAASGLQAALTTIRSSIDTSGDGNRGRLPCTAGSTTTFTNSGASSSTPGAVMQGAASNLPGNFRYQVSVAYYATDPTDRDPAWLSANALPCPLPATPLYAYLQSYGAGDAVVNATTSRGNRSQTGVYEFSVPRENIAGGRLRSFGKDVCLDAGASPAVGIKLYLQTCQPAGTPQQQWEYRKDLTIFYGGNPALNLCVQGSASEQPNLQRCTGTGNGSTYDYSAGQQVQEWSFNDNGHFAAGANDGNVTDQCIQPASTSVGAQLTLYTCTGSIDDFRAFDPDPAVGAGKAGGNTSGVVGAPTNQYVNFEQFGRCLDVKGQDVRNNYMIAYPCKQAPNSSKLTWNQVWYFQVVTGTNIGRMYTHTPVGYNKSPALDNTDYCLETPASGDVIAIKPCQSPVPVKQQWKATGEVPGIASGSYKLISQTSGTCMALGAREAGVGSSNVVLKPCGEALDQRWNAPPPPPNSGLNSIKEGTALQIGG